MVGSRKARVEKRQEGKLGIVTHACDPSTLEAEVEGASSYRASSRSAYTKIKACIKKRERDWNFLEGTGSKAYCSPEPSTDWAVPSQNEAVIRWC